MITDPDTGTVRKMSKRKGDPSYEDLMAQGYLSEAVVNYVALLGWAPHGALSEREFFTLPELVDAFDISGISKSPSAFDMDKLNYFNAAYLRAMSPDEFAQAAEPYIRQAVKNPAIIRQPSPPCSRPGVKSSLTFRRRWTFSMPCRSTAPSCSPTRSPKPPPRCPSICSRPPPPPWPPCPVGHRRPSMTPSSP